MPTGGFLILSGTHQVLIQDAGGLQWRDAHAGDYVCVPGGVFHAHRNITDQPAVDLIVTTARLGRFFTEIGRPVTDSLQPPTPEEVAHFVEVSTKYGYVLGTPRKTPPRGLDASVRGVIR